MTRPADAPLALPFARVGEIVGPAAARLVTLTDDLAAAGGVAETECMAVAARQLQAMAADPAAAGFDAEGSPESVCSRLRHDLRSPLVAVKGFGELVLEIAEEEGDGATGAAAHHVLDAVSEVLVAIERALPPQAPAAAREGEAPPAGPVGRILVADDSAQNRDVLVQYLTREGHQVTAVADGLAAYDAVTAQPFDLVLLDMIMPGMNGDEVLKAIKSSPDLRALPVIMVSALDESDNIARCIEIGAEDYLSKPFNRVLLRARIGACLEKKRLRQVELDYLAAVEKELNVARDVQMSILPRQFPPHVAAAGAGVMVPAREVGGDFYDFFRLDDDRIGIAVGDVSGKGVPAAVYMAMVRTLLRATALFGLSPSRCLERLNEQLSADNERGMFVSLFYGILDVVAGTFTYANAGHLWPLLIRADGATDWVRGADDLLLGVIWGGTYSEAELALASGDTVLVYTDGVVEAAAPSGEEFGRHRLAGLAGAWAGAEPAALLESMLAAVRGFEQGQPHSDDLTGVAIRFLGRVPGRSGFEMEIAADLVEVARLVAALDAYLHRHEVPVAAGYALTMAVEDCVAAIVRRAGGRGGARTIAVHLGLGAEGMLAEIVDDGASPEPEAKDAADGRLQFVMTLVARADYDRVEGRNRLRLFKPLG
ncbi:SpoIIE family protein phosphatase [Magnetospirillum sp. UT-4]|uniref:ATP-binding SpoIIE family protein phosphatase n=1 Tax=Magnetospirillum sp. UT-4 TaxID=2681467 RepID=UPI001384F739|nr:SpoIIE family protein phosphatase [Magnetospirillum sp. UT-4]CAA7625907.1 Serine phosphatase RsbU regulator sigma subunit (modular protein) [Magnetospirillum sp. UT-4]